MFIEPEKGKPASTEGDSLPQHWKRRDGKLFISLRKIGHGDQKSSIYLDFIKKLTYKNL